MYQANVSMASELWHPATHVTRKSEWCGSGDVFQHQVSCAEASVAEYRCDAEPSETLYLSALSGSRQKACWPLCCLASQVKWLRRKHKLFLLVDRPRWHGA